MAAKKTSLEKEVERVEEDMLASLYGLNNCQLCTFTYLRVLNVREGNVKITAARLLKRELADTTRRVQESAQKLAKLVDKVAREALLRSHEKSRKKTKKK